MGLETSDVCDITNTRRNGSWMFHCHCELWTLSRPIFQVTECNSEVLTLSIQWEFEYKHVYRSSLVQWIWPQCCKNIYILLLNWSKTILKVRLKTLYVTCRYHKPNHAKWTKTDKNMPKLKKNEFQTGINAFQRFTFNKIYLFQWFLYLSLCRTYV